MAIIFIYIKNKELVFLDESDGQYKHNELLEDGYDHFSTVSAAICFASIYKIIQSEKTATDKVKAVRKLLYE